MKPIYNLKRSLLVCLLLPSVVGFGQQQIVFNTYNFDMMPINIAANGRNYLNTSLNYRAQSVSVKNSPRLYQFNGSISLGSQALGLKVSQFSMGLLDFKTITGAYIYKLKLNETDKLHMGLGASFMQNGFGGPRAVVDSRQDIVLKGAESQLRSNNFDCEAGLAWYGEKITAGLAVNHLYNTNQGSGSIKLNQEYNLHAAYRFDLNESVELIPLLLTRYTYKGAGASPELLVTSIYKKTVSAALGYRFPRVMMANLGAVYKGFKVGYSFDYAIGTVSRAFGASHQVYLGFTLSENKKKEN